MGGILAADDHLDRALKVVGGLLVIAILVGACAPADRPSDATLGSWHTTSLTDVRTGETFTIADLKGKLVVIEPMATWCFSCQVQQSAVAEALARGAQPDLVYVSLDVDPNEHPEDLARYADEAGFTWRFVIASSEVARSLAADFGDQVLSPPSTPSILIGADGEFIEKHLGVRGADELVTLFDRNGP